MYTRSRGVQLSLSTRSLARLHQEEAKKRKRARATRRRIPRFAPAGRKGVERSRNVREEKEGAKEEGEEEAEQEKKEMREREVRENRRSERIEQEAIRECLMPRTKLCNYLHVRLKTILTSANACSSARVCDAMRVPVPVRRTCTSNTMTSRSYVCVCVKREKRKKERDKERKIGR